MMSIHETMSAEIGQTAAELPSRRRIRATRLIAGFMAASGVLFGIFTAVFGMVAESQQIHAFHNTVVASLLLVLSAPPAIAIARKPDHPLAGLRILTALSAAAVVTMAASTTIDPFTLPFVLFTGVLWILRPSEQPSADDERPSWILLGLVAVGVVPLLAYALGEAQLQRTLTDSSHAQFFHWVEASFYAVGILAIALLAALRPFTYRMAAWSAGVGVIILGSASLMLNSHVSAVPVPWSWLAIAGGVAFIGVAEWEVDRHADHGLTAT
jgi:hypothetical protein